MFEIATDAARGVNIFADSRHPWHQATHPAHDEIDRYTSLGCLIESIDNVCIDRCIDFGNDASEFTSLAMDDFEIYPIQTKSRSSESSSFHVP
jgi:hypothetical protein